jgi:hypothetical protein
MKRLTFSCYSVTIHKKTIKNMIVVLNGEQCMFIKKRIGMSSNIKLRALCTFTVHPAVTLLRNKKSAITADLSMCIGNDS